MGSTEEPFQKVISLGEQGKMKYIPKGWSFYEHEEGNWSMTGKNFVLERSNAPPPKGAGKQLKEIPAGERMKKM